MKWFFLILLIGCIGLYVKFESFRNAVKGIIKCLHGLMTALWKRFLSYLTDKLNVRNGQQIKDLTVEIENLQSKIDGYQEQFEKKSKRILDLGNELKQSKADNAQLATDKTEINEKLNELQKIHGYIYTVPKTISVEFLNQFEEIITLLNNGEEIIKRWYKNTKDKLLVQNISTEYLKYFLSKPENEIKKWHAVVENLRYSIMVDEIKSTLMHEPNDEQRVQALKKMIFYSLYRDYINKILLMMESVRSMCHSESYDEIGQYIALLIDTLRNFDITVVYYPLYKEITDFSKVEIINSKEIPDNSIPKDGVIKVHKYAVNSPKLGIAEEKSIIEIKI